jgi:RHS repeat-associated protein
VDVPVQAGVAMADPHLCAPIDANGNLTSDGTRTFEWDARNQLVAVTVGTHRSEFVYDGLRRRVSTVEKENGVVQSHLRAVWCEMTICEDRAADGVAVTRRAFALGEQVNGQARYFTTDHLGSVREVTDIAGTLLARYAFDPWGRRTVTAGTDVTTVGFTGHRTHTGSGLALTMFRGYDLGPARWLSEDPASHVGGLNLYGYVGNNPIRKVDPYGLAPWDFVLCWWYYPKCEKSAKKCEMEMRQCDMVEVMIENQCASWGACVVRKCFVENPDCEKAWKYCGKSTIPTRPPGTR